MSHKSKKPEQRCGMSDLYTSQCDHCRRKERTLTAPKVDDRPVLNDVVVADHPGTCQVCHQDIMEGDHIGWFDEIKVKDPNTPDGYRIRKRWAHYGCGS